MIRFRRRAAVTALGLALLVPATYVSPAASQEATDSTPSGDFTVHEEYFESLDGTELHAYVYRPTWVGDDPTPVQLVVTPYAGSGLTGEPGRYRGGTLGYGPRTFEEGYTAVAVSLPGIGGSAGCPDLGGPREQAAARAAVEWAREQPWSNGKVGVTGLSYPGLGALMTLAMRDDNYQGPDAIVFAAAPTGYEQVFENGVPQMLFGQLPHGWWMFYGGNHAHTPPSPESDSRQHENYLQSVTATPSCAPSALTGNTNPDPETDYWRERDIPELIAGAEVPVLGYQGLDDTGVPAKQLFPVMDALAGPWRALIGPWPHHPPGSREETGQDLMYDWLNHHLRGEPLEDAPRWRVQTPDGAWRGEEVWPPTDAQPYEMPVLDGFYRDVHGNQSETEPAENVDRIVGLPDGIPPINGVGSWTFSPPLPHQAHLAGQTGVRVELHAPVPGAHVIGLLYEVKPDGTAEFITRGATTVPGLFPSEVSFDLRQQDWKLDEGSRIGLLVTGADDWMYGSGNTGQPVRILGGSLSLPLLRYDRESVEEPVDAGPFRPWEGRPAGFEVDQATINERTVDADPPPQMEPFPEEEPECREPGRPTDDGQPRQPVCPPTQPR